MTATAKQSHNDGSIKTQVRDSTEHSLTDALCTASSATADAVSESKLAERKTLGETSATCPDKSG